MGTQFEREMRLPTVAIIDDDLTSSIVLENMLKKEGIRTVKATGGVSGRALVQAEQPDLILLDIFMPDENGFETIKKLKEDTSTTEIPVMFITARTDLDSKVMGFNLGAVDYITKPYMAPEVLARVRLHIRLRHAIASFMDAQIARLKHLTEAHQAIMPSPHDIPEANFSVFYKAAHEVGGDFYDVMLSGVGIHDYVVADVSGHDLGSSLATSALKALLYQGRTSLSTPLETLKMANHVLWSAFPEELYMTLVYVRLNRQRNIVTLISAGHPPGILLKAQGEISLLPYTGDVLGAFEMANLAVTEIPVGKGDRILLYTDGLVEYRADKPIVRDEGTKRLLSLCREKNGLSISGMITEVSRELMKPQQQQPADDLLLLGLEV